MWPCHPDVRKKVTFWGRLLVVSCFLHLIALFVLFFVYRGYYGGYQTLVVALNKKMQGPVVFLPLYKRVGGRLAGASGVVSNKKAVGTKTVKHTGLGIHDQSQKKQQQQQKEKKHREKNKQKASAKTKKDKATASKKAETIKKEQAKVQEKKSEIKKPEVQKREMPDKKKQAELEKPVPEQMKQQERIIEQTQEQQLVPTQEAQESVQEASAEPVYIGQAERDFLQMHEEIQRVLQEHWRPPVGLHREVTCHVRVMVDWNGKACAITIEKSSGIAMYDISARATLTKMQFPHCACGKEMVIHFST